MNSNKQPCVIGTIRVARRQFQVCLLTCPVDDLTRGLSGHDGLILTTPDQVPLVVLRLGDLIKNGYLKRVQPDEPRLNSGVCAAVDLAKSRSGPDRLEPNSQQQPERGIAGRKETR